ncbi:C-C motif chemokine 16 [Sorex araneus]|uniref:C-C motif chemokine 16 n=1 Tax=Sorex araneus TaxID=42254 RepID=UPI002433C5E4|nr:C-C motif chemokine 16 [Sorex araneus]
MRVLVAALLLLTLLLTSTSVSHCQPRMPESVNIPHSCCRKYVQKVMPRKHVLGYRKALNCNLPAIIFINRKSKEVCVNPRSQWVQDLLKDPSLPLLPFGRLVQN